MVHCALSVVRSFETCTHRSCLSNKTQHWHTRKCVHRHDGFVLVHKRDNHCHRHHCRHYYSACSIFTFLKDYLDCAGNLPARGATVGVQARSWPGDGGAAITWGKKLLQRKWFQRRNREAHRWEYHYVTKLEGLHSLLVTPFASTVKGINGFWTWW